MSQSPEPSRIITFSRLNRRQFIRYSTVTAAILGTAPSFLRGQNLNSKLNIAVIGAGGKGAVDTDACNSENIVALCDVDQKTLDGRLAKYPGAQGFQDYRKMLEKIHKSIDAAIVSTPDNHHAIAASMAMKLKKHVYVQKPLTHDVYEARFLRDLAKKQKVATQMGNQGSAEDGLRRAVEVIQAGAIGKVTQVHVWTNRPIWPQGMDRPDGSDPVPATLDWDLWLGPAPFRPFKDQYPNAGAQTGRRKGVYHPFAWRGWQDFGTGALGDMACHTANMPFRALKLGYPSSIEAESSGINHESWPSSSHIHFKFPEREGGLPPVDFWWYDGGRKPDDATAEKVLDFLETQKDKQGRPMGRKLPTSGCLLIGDKGHLFSPDDYGAHFYMLPEKNFVGYEGPAPSIPRSPGHYKEWIEACKGGPAAYSNFDIAAYLTEIILLGCVALKAGQRVDWDGPKMKAMNMDVEHLIKRKYRDGWHLYS